MKENKFEKMHEADQFLVRSPEDRLFARPACVCTVSVSDFIGYT